MTILRGPLSALLLLLALCVLAGCNTHTDKISDITNNPAAYAHKDVTIAGEVTKVYEMPLGITDLAAYRVNDGTGQIWVISHSGAPVVGDKIGLKGRVREAGAFDGTDLGTIIEEHQRRLQ